MKKTTFILIIIFFTLTALAFGQVAENKNYFPIWTYHQNSINIHGISIGLGSLRSEPRFTNTNGIKIEIIGAGILTPLIPESPVAKNDSLFIALSKLPISERINGLSLSLSGTVCDCKTNGINAGLVGNINYQVNGLTGSIFANFAQIHNGFQFAMWNESYFMNGLQLGLYNNNHKTEGLQIGLLSNESKEMKGLQVGLFNKSEKFRGFQFGLWNVNQKRKLPIVNWNFKKI